ncbi:MAG: PD-(D/E)XK nuclease family protein [Bacteroidales bacterium]|nr:PD-(D/E)XK nuclease family protein [Bacteroidales bacterium]MCM1416494.1 PD-(D/E)XK nuclease family protein [bacterium]MCM1422665.1 PD-(D/E)XK nuclease family protein [bacterium]
MSLQFYFGASGAGKSRKLHEFIIEESLRHPEKNYLLIVPDQFTMQTQMDLVVEHPRHAIMNIDVLSFGRLTHRVIEEVGGEELPVLDDTGKSLVLRKIAGQERENLTVLGSRLNRIGYIHEVKSALSEFMQYGVGEKELDVLIACAKGRGALYHKLRDLKVLYRAFTEYKRDQFITTEETLDKLREALPKSQIVRDAVIAFDGFTGFTPIQNRVIQDLLGLTERVIVTLTADEREDPYRMAGEQKLFYLTQKTVASLLKLAQEIGVSEEPAVWCGGNRTGRLPRFAGNPELAHLERNLFRYPAVRYGEKTERIHLFEATTPAEELRQTCIAIKKLFLKSDTLCYRDIAVVTGNMEVYGKEAQEVFARFGIPIYLDRTTGILGNPFSAYLRSALQIILQDFSPTAVFHYLRTGLAGFAREEIDRLENYIRRFGIRGRKKWSEAFVYREEDPEGEEASLRALAAYNALRERLMEQMKPFLAPMRTAREMVRALYRFLETAQVQQKLADYEAAFSKAGDSARAKEYGQIYPRVIDLLDQMDALLAGEEMTFQEFADILDSGIAEITVGTIPQNVDRILVGDIERTRLKQVKVLFFLGVNDGNIPKGSGGGIISDLDREFLKGSQIELAPTPRQQMYIQRLYLYLNVTKPSQELYLSYARIGEDGRTLRPAYLIDLLRGLFPTLIAARPESGAVSEQLVCGADGVSFVADSLREYAAGRLPDAKEQAFYTFYRCYLQDAQYREKVETLTEAAFAQYADTPLTKVVSAALYGSSLLGSVSRLEKYAACAYAHFLQYGLRLRERGEYGFEAVDMGNLFHQTLEIFGERLAAHGYTWLTFPEEESGALVAEALTACAAVYGETVLYSSERNRHLLGRIERILNRTVRTLRIQLQKGRFLPEAFEVSFDSLEKLDALNIALTEQEKIRLRGRIDRVDLCEQGDKVYVKVIDYKSGKHSFDLAALYYGLQLQLVVYMNAAQELTQKKYPDKEVHPAAMLYYRVADPIVEAEGDVLPEEINQRILRELKMTGIVNDSDDAVSLLDADFAEKSDILPLERKKDGTFSAASGVMAEEDMRAVSNYVNHKIRQLGAEILNGTISVNPCEFGSDKACTYCAYRNVCGYDGGAAQSGYPARKLPKMGTAETLNLIREELSETAE